MDAEEACQIVDADEVSYTTGYASATWREAAHVLRQALAEAQSELQNTHGDWDESVRQLVRCDAERHALRRKLDAATEALTAFNYPADGSIEDMQALALASLESDQ